MIKGKHGGNMGPGRVPHQENAGRIATVLCDVACGPNYRFGPIFQKAGVNLRVHPVVRYHHDVSPLRQGRRPEEIVAAPFLPGATVEKRPPDVGAGQLHRWLADRCPAVAVGGRCVARRRALGANQRSSGVMAFTSRTGEHAASTHRIARDKTQAGGDAAKPR